MSDKTGGPAFPIWTEDMPIAGSPGMTLLDYFAAKAMQAGLTNAGEYPLSNKVHAKCAYSTAEAMIAERAKRMGNEG